MKRAALYVRVSTEEQKNHGLSVDSQIVALEEYCKNNGYYEVGIYNDAGISASKSYKKRPELLRMIADIKQGRIDTVLFTRLDRFFRSVPDYYACTEQMNNIPWRAIWEDYETETAAGTFKVNIMLSVAQAESQRTSERIKSVNKYKIDKGDYVGKAPLGYVKTKGKLIKDDNIKDGIQAFFDEYLKTGSISIAQRKALEKGMPFDRTHIYKMIKNKAYAGIAANNYKCEPYITMEEYNLIQARIGHQPRKSKSDRVYLFSGILKCKYCGHRMTAHAVKRIHADGAKVIYHKYECTSNNTTKMIHPHLQIVENGMETYLINELENIYLDRVKEIRTMNKALAGKDISSKKKKLESKLKRLALLFEDGDISQEEYISKRDKTKAELSTLDIKTIPEPQPLPMEWKLIYNDLDQEHKQQFWRRIINYIEVDNETKKYPHIVFK